MQNRQLYRFLKRTPKDKLLELSLKYCAHGHSFLSHPKCFADEMEETVGFFDIETSALDAEFGYCLTWAMKVVCGENVEYKSSRITQAEILGGMFDKRIVIEFIEAMSSCDRLIGYYSARFDLPFMRTRALKWGLDFPKWKEMWHTDVFDIVKRKFKLARRRLANACHLLGIDAKNHPLEGDVWQLAKIGDEKAIDYVMTHNIEDVDSTAKLWHRVNEYANVTRTSI